MMREHVARGLATHEPHACALLAWHQVDERGPRVDVVYAVSNPRLLGMGHWCAECCWYEGDCLIVAYEASVFARMLLVGHPRALALWGTPITERWGAGEALAVGFPLESSTLTRFESVARWLDGVRGG